jgi:hypothetical protein
VGPLCAFLLVFVLWAGHDDDLTPIQESVVCQGDFVLGREMNDE